MVSASGGDHDIEQSANLAVGIISQASISAVPLHDKLPQEIPHGESRESAVRNFEVLPIKAEELIRIESLPYVT